MIPPLSGMNQQFDRGFVSPTSMRNVMTQGNPPRLAQGNPPRLVQNPVVMTPPIQLVEDDEYGQLQERRTTDSPWKWLLLAYLTGAFIIAVYALSHGRPARLYKGIDIAGRVCGVDYDVRDMPYLLFPMDPVTGQLLQSDVRCVATCPTQDDVLKRLTIGSIKRIVKRYNDVGASMVYEFNVATPAYASTVIANAYCLPLDVKLQNQVLPVLNVFWRQASFAVGGFCSTFGLLISYTMLGIAMAGVICLTLIQMLPTTTVYIFAASLPTVLIAGGFVFISTGINGGTYNFSSYLFSANYSWSFMFGLVMLILGAALTVYEITSPLGRARASKVLSMTAYVFSDMRNAIVGPAIAAAASLVLVLLWMIVFVHICSLGYIETQSVSGVSGSVEATTALLVAPLRRYLLFPVFGFFAGIYWIGALFWIIEIIKATHCFVISYAGTVWYFSSPEGYDRKEMGWCPILTALSVVCNNHIGSVAFVGILFGVTSPIRTFFSWAASRNESCTDTSGQFLSRIFGVITPYCTIIVDLLGAGGFTEMAISSTNIWVAMEIASRRLGLQYSPTGRLYGSLSGLTNRISGTAAVVISVIVFSKISSGKGVAVYDSPTSPYFVSSPVFIALVCFLSCWLTVSYFATMWSTLADALLYSYLVESSSIAGEIDENPNEKLNAHTQMRDLIMEAMDELSVYY